MSEAPTHSQQVTLWLEDWCAGDNAAGQLLVDRIYPELRQIANRILHSERPYHTLEPNALVNELWLRLIHGAPVPYRNRIHFFAIAAQTMRRILIDYARARDADKRGGHWHQVSLSAVDRWNPAAQNEDMLALDEALAKLEKADPRAARVVELRFFGGLLEDEIATLLGISVITVKRDWKVARAWLMAQLSL